MKARTRPNVWTTLCHSLRHSESSEYKQREPCKPSLVAPLLGGSELVMSSLTTPAEIDARAGNAKTGGSALAVHVDPRKVLRKLDLRLLPVACTLYFLCSLYVAEMLLLAPRIRDILTPFFASDRTNIGTNFHLAPSESTLLTMMWHSYRR